MRCAKTKTSSSETKRCAPAAPRAEGSARGPQGFGAADPSQLGQRRRCSAGTRSGPPLSGAPLGSARAAPRWYVPPAACPSSAALPAGGRCRKCRHFGVFCSGGSGRGGGGGTRRLPRDSASAARRRRLRRRRQQLRQRQAQVQPLVSAAAAG